MKHQKLTFHSSRSILMPRFLLLLFFLAFSFSTATAQYASPQDDYLRQSVQRKDFDQKKWKSLKEGIDYSNKNKKEKKKEKKVEAPTGGFGLGQFAKFLIIAVGIGLLVLIIVKMASGNDLFLRRNRKLKSAVADINLEQIEENLEESELEDPIRQAAAAGNFALAVRLYYLSILKELSLKKRIRWKRDKTNGEYLRELAGSPLFSPVQEATLIFERVWYGQAELEREDFLKMESKFQQTVAAVQQ